MTRGDLPRRRVLQLAGTTAALGLAGCGGDGGGANDGDETATDQPTETATETAMETQTATDTPTETATTTDGETATQTATETQTEMAATTVTAIDFAFDPKRVSVETGTTVEWTNDDGVAHDVVNAQFHDAAEQWNFDEDLPAGATVSHTFESEGIYEYYCSIHGQSSMCGVVLVGGASLSGDLPCEEGGGGGMGGGY